MSWQPSGPSLNQFGGGQPPSAPPPPGGYTSNPPPPFRPSWAPTQPAPSRMSPGKIVAVFVGALLALALIGGVLVMLSAPPPPVPPCAPNQPCAPVPSLPPVAGGSPLPISTPRPHSSPAALPTPGAPVPSAPTSDSPPVIANTLYTDSSLGYSFEYDPDVFSLADHSNGSAVLSGQFFDTQIWIDAVTADTSPSKMIENELGFVDRFLIARVPDTDTYDALLGPSIGYIPGQGGVFSGTLTSRDGTPIAPGGVAIVSSSDGRITVAVVVIVGTPDARQGGDTQEHSVRSAADDLLKTFNWNAQ